MDMNNLFARLGVEFTARAEAFFKQEDQLRLYTCQKRASEVQRNRRKYKAREKVAAEETAIAEGGGGGLHMVQVNFELEHCTLTLTTVYHNCMVFVS